MWISSRTGPPSVLAKALGRVRPSRKPIARCGVPTHALADAQVLIAHSDLDRSRGSVNRRFIAERNANRIAMATA